MLNDYDRMQRPRKMVSMVVYSGRAEASGEQ